MKKQLKNNKGMTLIELTVVILVLLSLISVLFIGAKAWKDGSDKANCIMNIRNFQTAARSLTNLDNENYGPTDSVVLDDILEFMGGAVGGTAIDLNCPAAGTYSVTAGSVFGAAPGTVFLECTVATHVPSATQSSQW